MSEPILQWEEPIYFLNRKDHSHTAAESVPRASLRRRWFENVWEAPLLRMAVTLGVGVLFVAALLTVSTGDYSYSGIAASVGTALLLFLLRSHAVWVASLRTPDLPASTISLMNDAITITAKFEMKVRWPYAEIVRAQVGVVKYEEGERPILRVKVRGASWQEVNVAPEIPLEELRSALRGKGIRVQQQVKRRWYE